jgi:hypothetical protein
MPFAADSGARTHVLSLVRGDKVASIAIAGSCCCFSAKSRRLSPAVTGHILHRPCPGLGLRLPFAARTIFQRYQRFFNRLAAEKLDVNAVRPRLRALPDFPRGSRTDLRPRIG